ncbi:hypothetical protein RvY_17364 [Ramazzottius varieornatus]|uniref:RRM domain-containing protein n=1 Tax=Ramazzottius varieornatus TaxID=947166 RepID=A0A1D1W1V3_RAMVA|nr:hypothetical protein RvY_17364 [Ramazzottius varieornatus]
MSALKKRRMSKTFAEAEPEAGSSPNLFLALDCIPLSVSFSQIKAFFRPIRLSGIKLDVSYGALRAAQVEFFTVVDRELALESKVIAGQRHFLRSPKDMRAEKPGCGWEVVCPILQRELFSH